MKKMICIIAMIFTVHHVQSQWITAMHVVPAAPTTADNVQVIVEAQFPSGGCADWYILNQVQNGFEYTYHIVNCVGMLTVICPHNDTIPVGGPLPAGSYSVIVNLNAGSGERPCTPFSQWVSDTVFFDVSQLSGMPGMKNIINPIILSPGLVKDFLTIELPAFTGETSLSFYDLSGRLLLIQAMRQSKEEINVSSFAAGVYFVRAGNNNDASAIKFMKE